MLKLKIISPTETIFDGEIKHAFFPGEIGLFEVLPKHAPLISSLVKGEITYTLKSDEEKKIRISSGFVEVNADIITACIEN
ncbi:MAG: F0F1 ATP synthase subunit epsilon [Tannerella sp.]|jgi:F-type H+-transporting ATPase subunit epsilon|nr:F0F1 ATP synthase subunit epsilon [Tannerella sp.]